MTMAENVMLKLITFLCRMPVVSLKLSCLLQSICHIMFFFKMYHFCSFVTLSSVNSGRDIEFCFYCGMSVGDAFLSDSLVSSVCTVHKSCNS